MLYNCEYHRVTHKFTELFVCMTIDHIISIFQSDMIVILFAHHSSQIVFIDREGITLH